MGQLNLVQEAVRHQRKRILHLFRAFSMTTDLAGVRLQPSRARWKLLFGLPQLELPKGLRINVVIPRAKRIRISICPVLHRHDSVEDGKLDKPTNGYLGEQTGRLQS